MKKWFVLFVVVVGWVWGSGRVFALEVERFDVPVEYEWIVTFNEPVDYAVVTVKDADGTPHLVTVRRAGDYQVRVKPLVPYAWETVYEVTVSPFTRSQKGQPLEPYTFMFKTERLSLVEPEPEPEPIPEPEPEPVVDGDVYLSDYSFVWVHDPDVPVERFHLDGRAPGANGALVAGLTMSALHDYGLPGKVGYTRDYVRYVHRGDTLVEELYNGHYIKRLPNRHYIDTFLSDGRYIHYVYDAYNEDRVRTIFWTTVEAEHERTHYFTKGDALYEASMRELVRLFANVDRAKVGSRWLGKNERLDAVAHAHSVDMIERNYFAHVAPDGSTPDDRVRRAGFSNFGTVEENITKGQQNAIFAHEAFMHSGGHRLTMLGRGNDTLGVGVKLSKGGTPYVTQLYVRLH